MPLLHNGTWSIEPKEIPVTLDGGIGTYCPAISGILMELCHLSIEQEGV